MKLYSSSIFFSLIILVLCSQITACKKTVHIDEPVHLITTEAVFSSDKTATAAIAGIYSEMMRTRYYFASGAMTIYPGMSADEFYSSLPSSQRDVFKDNTLTASNNTIRNEFWRFGYSFIYRANACIEGLKTSERIDLVTKRQLTGEALFIRALCHFYLINLFGDVPLVTTSDYRINAELGRVAVPVVYSQIEEDLLAATELMSATYVTTGKVRPNKWAATALLARVYLYQKKWAEAEAAASGVIANGGYSLVPDVNNVFLANSDEAIWQLMPVITNPGNNTHEGFLFVPYNATTVPTFRLREQLVTAFETGDARMNWVGKNIVNGIDYFYPLKYKVASTAPAAPLEYNMVLRLAEQYLIRAEARANRENLTGALDDLNRIRNRAGLSAISPVNLENLLQAIEQERRIELFVEWGHRWFDIKRTGRANDVLKTVKGDNWQESDALYPIPLGEILINSKLTQNPGY